MQIGGNVNVIIKMDMKKSYDRVNWNFMVKMLKALGFSDEWINLLMRTVDYNHFSILIMVNCVIF